ncbi:hypothetical protein CsatA_012191 [Cannabis sativa]
MELYTCDWLSYLLYLILTIFISKQIFNLLFSSTKTQQHLPPGPKPLPIIGNLLELGHNPHKSLAKLSHIHGPIMSLKLGRITTIVVSSAEMAKQILQTHDNLFSNRTVPDSLKACDHHNHGMSFSPISPSWRNLRKICNNHLFSIKALDFNQNLRQQKVQELLADVRTMGAAGDEAVAIGVAGFKTTLNLMSTTFFSADWENLRASDMAVDLKETIRNLMVAAGKPNLSDYFPVLRKLDLLGLRRSMTFHFGKLKGFFDGVITQRLKQREESNSPNGEEENNNMLDTLLNYMASKENREIQLLNKTTIEHLLMDLFAAGTDTTASTLEWSMAELLKNPEAMSNAQAELKQVIGKGNIMKESDITRLPYLQAVIKETFRLHPPAPLLLPRRAETDVELCGYVVPEGAQLEDGVTPQTLNMDEKFGLTLQKAQPLKALPIPIN